MGWGEERVADASFLACPMCGKPRPILESARRGSTLVVRLGLCLCEKITVTISKEPLRIGTECNGICLTGYDVGVPEYGNGIAYAHPDCPAHGLDAGRISNFDQVVPFPEEER